MKKKSIFVCQDCGTQHRQWLGRCNNCLGWNTLAEELIETNTLAKTNVGLTGLSTPMNQIHTLDEDRKATQILEIDRVLGGGIVKGSVILLGGDPGIGKSTLALQISKQYAQMGEKVLYVSGEESPPQLKLRAERMHCNAEEIWVYPETNVEKILIEIEKTKPALIIIDSVQTLHHPSLIAAPGSIVQIRETSAMIWKAAKEKQIPCILIGHITKDGGIAGPKLLEHMVDTVLYFEGDRHGHFRILRCMKNRFGSTLEMGIFEMKAEGLISVENPSQKLIHERAINQAGSCIAATLEGSRSFLVEIQALASSCYNNFPKRLFTGVDSSRALMVIASLEKKCGLALATEDIFINVAGGFKTYEPAMDLPIALSILSSFKNLILPADWAFCGEIGLAGEIRSIPHIDRRVAEAQKLGFKTIVLPNFCKNQLDLKHWNIEILFIKDLPELFQILETATQRLRMLSPN